MSIRFRGYPNWPSRRDARGVPSAHDPDDEQLMAQLAAGRQEALGPLYSRYAARLFSLAAQSLDRATAEEMVQEVFLQVWRKAATFRPERGTFRAWVFQIAHYRVLNELRRRSRQPQLEEDPEGLRLSAAPDPMPGPEELVTTEARRAEVREALEALPDPQRQALEMAFVDGLTHEQVARSLQLPLGTTKTRIRAGLRRLRAGLTPAIAALVIAAGIGGVLGIRNEEASRALDGRALALLTSSETVAIRLVAAPGTPPETHAVYRGHTGAAIAVLTLEKFRPAPAGEVYQAWVRHGETWTSVGTVHPDGQGAARLIVEGAAVERLPDAIEITLEPARGSPNPHGPVVVSGQPGSAGTQYR
ncbi:MAG TPA: sigma-70 family RNA polymerase sigma factor [bacterium]|nr:sigma-70 family RNA polymerase sigma factor [bacterium]